MSVVVVFGVPVDVVEQLPLQVGELGLVVGLVVVDVTAAVPADGHVEPDRLCTVRAGSPVASLDQVLVGRAVVGREGRRAAR